MTVFNSIDAAARAQALKGAAVCLGNFDGVHLGHQALLRTAQAQGRAAAFTFDPHPAKVLQPELGPHLITTRGRKLQLLAEAGAHDVVIQPFSLEFAKTPPERFESDLFDALGVGHAVVGADFTYGAKRAGSVKTLIAAAQGRGARVHVVEPVTIDGIVVSSTRVRQFVLEGRVGAAAQLLGRPFDLEGVVVTGQGRGRGIGFPTANVDTPNELRPAPGVYAVRALVDGTTEWKGGAANIGVKPTFGGGAVTIEVHLFDFSGDLYGKSLRVQFLDRLRAEQRFASAQELAQQIARDLEHAREAVARAAT